MQRSGYQRVSTKDDVLPSVHTPQHGAPSKPKQSSDYRLDDSAVDFLTRPIPYASICLAIFLMLFGMTCFVLAWMHFTQAILGKQRAEVGFTVLGAVTFLPGFYHTRIAYYTWRGEKGYKWDDIPAFY